ncbi:MAG: nuclear transport factor 2 family protein [Pseudomonadales bacterium]|nr:nuclear transport factor 2 family protein [Pseudomonadales bacterium]
MMKAGKACFVVAVMMMGGFAMADPGKGGSAPAQQGDVEDLPVCYARGTDTLGSAVDAVAVADLNATTNVGNPGFDAGLALYRACFSDDFSFTLQFDGVTALTVPDPATRTADTDAALQWANFVNNAFRGPGYKNTQHHMGSISSEIRGRHAQVVSYLIATHTYGPAGAAPEGSTAVVGGTYTDEAVREHGHWVIKQRTLNITSSITHLAP